MSATTFFSPRYFASSYFRGLQPIREEPPLEHVTDLQIYDAVVSALRGTRVFNRVSFPSPGQVPPSASPDNATAIVSPKAWQEMSDSRGSRVLRELRFSLTLSLNPSDKRDAFDRLMWLGNIVQDLIDGSSLGGLTIAEKTRLNRGLWEFGVRGFNTQLTIDGKTAYVLDRRRGRNESPN